MFIMEKQPEYGSWMQYALSLSIARQLIVFLSATSLSAPLLKVVLLTDPRLSCLRRLKPLEAKSSTRCSTWLKELSCSSLS
jgi:hypothetical protein